MTTKRSSWQIQRAVVFALMMREIKTRFGGHWTGVVWLFGIPLAQLAVFMWANIMLRGRVSRMGYDFVVFLLVAMLPYGLFKSLWTQLMNAVSSNKGLFGFKQVKPMDTFVARVVLEVAMQIFIFVILAVVLARIGFGPLLPVDLLAYLGYVGMFCLMGIALGITSAVICEDFPRFSVFVTLLSMPLMIMSGIIFQLHALPQSVLYWFLFNPALHLVELCRHAYLPHYVMVQGVDVLYPAKFIVINLMIAMSLYRVRRRELIAR